MAVFRCTKKLLTELKITSVPEITDEDMLSSWHANFLWIDRRKCVLFTHTKTLYTVFLSRLHKPQFEDIGLVFREQLYQNLVSDEFKPIQIEYLMNAQRNFVITKTNNRSVLASMNDQVNDIWMTTNKNGGLVHANLAHVAHCLNSTPMGALELYFPERAMRAFLDESLALTGYQLPDRRIE